MRPPYVEFSRNCSGAAVRQGPGRTRFQVTLKVGFQLKSEERGLLYWVRSRCQHFVDWPEESGHKSVEQGRKAKMGSAYRAPVHHRTAASYWHIARPPRSPGSRSAGQNPKDQPGHHGPYRLNRRPSSGYLIQNSVSKSALPWRSYIWHTREPLTGQSSESWAACVERPVDPCGRAEATVISLLLNVFRVIPRACSSQWRHSSQSTSRRTYSSPSLLGRNDARRANRKSGA